MSKVSPIAWREGARIRHADGRGFVDSVSDAQIRAYLDADVESGDFEAAAFCAAVLSLRSRERHELAAVHRIATS
jgi:hypothetical protein